MSDKAEIKTGTKIDREEMLKTPIGQLAVMITSPPTSDAVEGQYRYDGYTRCPWCGHIGWTYGLSSNVYMAVVCGACGMPFRA
jgi:hypothetical protein